MVTGIIDSPHTPSHIISPSLEGLPGEMLSTIFSYSGKMIPQLSTTVASVLDNQVQKMGNIDRLKLKVSTLTSQHPNLNSILQSGQTKDYLAIVKFLKKEIHILGLTNDPRAAQFLSSPTVANLLVADTLIEERNAALLVCKSAPISYTRLRFCFLWQDFTINTHTYTTPAVEQGHKSKLTRIPFSIIDTLRRSTDKFALDFSNNHLMHIPNAISSLTNLQKLDVSNNELTNLPNELSGLPNLQKLDVSNNQLTTLPKNLVDLPSIETIVLDKNPIKTLPKELSPLFYSRFIIPFWHSDWNFFRGCFLSIFISNINQSAKYRFYLEPTETSTAKECLYKLRIPIEKILELLRLFIVLIVTFLLVCACGPSDD